MLEIHVLCLYLEGIEDEDYVNASDFSAQRIEKIEKRIKTKGKLYLTEGICLCSYEICILILSCLLYRIRGTGHNGHLPYMFRAYKKN